LTFALFFVTLVLTRPSCLYSFRHSFTLSFTLSPPPGRVHTDPHGTTHATTHATAHATHVSDHVTLHLLLQVQTLLYTRYPDVLAPVKYPMYGALVDLCGQGRITETGTGD